MEDSPNDPLPDCERLVLSISIRNSIQIVTFYPHCLHTLFLVHFENSLNDNAILALPL